MDANWVRERTKILNKIFRDNDVLEIIKSDEIHHTLYINFGESIPGHPLITLSSIGYQNGVDKILDAGIDPNLRSGKDSNTMLHTAARYHESDTKAFVQHLIKRGASIKTLNHNGLTPVMVAMRESNSQACYAMLPYMDRWSVETQGPGRNTVLHFAAEQQWDWCLQHLLQIRGVSSSNVLDRVNNEECTALDIAASKGSEKCVKILLEAGSDILEPRKTKFLKEGYTSICKAFENGKANIARIMLEDLNDEEMREYTQMNTRRLVNSFEVNDNVVVTNLFRIVYPALNLLGHTNIGRPVIMRGNVMSKMLHRIALHTKHEAETCKSLSLLYRLLFSGHELHRKLAERFAVSDNLQVMLSIFETCKNEVRPWTRSIPGHIILILVPLCITFPSVKAWFKKNFTSIGPHVKNFMKNYTKDVEMRHLILLKTFPKFWDPFKVFYFHAAAASAEKIQKELLKKEEMEKSKMERRTDRKKKKHALNSCSNTEIDVRTEQEICVKDNKKDSNEKIQLEKNELDMEVEQDEMSMNKLTMTILNNKHTVPCVEAKATDTITSRDESKFEKVLPKKMVRKAKKQNREKLEITRGSTPKNKTKANCGKVDGKGDGQSKTKMVKEPKILGEKLPNKGVCPGQVKKKNPHMEVKAPESQSNTNKPVVSAWFPARGKSVQKDRFVALDQKQQLSGEASAKMTSDEHSKALSQTGVSPVPKMEEKITKTAQNECQLNNWFPVIEKRVKQDGDVALDQEYVPSGKSMGELTCQEHSQALSERSVSPIPKVEAEEKNTTEVEDEGQSLDEPVVSAWFSVIDTNIKQDGHGTVDQEHELLGGAMAEPNSQGCSQALSERSVSPITKTDKNILLGQTKCVKAQPERLDATDNIFRKDSFWANLMGQQDVPGENHFDRDSQDAKDPNDDVNQEGKFDEIEVLFAGVKESKAPESDQGDSSENYADLPMFLKWSVEARNGQSSSLQSDVSCSGIKGTPYDGGEPPSQVLTCSEDSAKRSPSPEFSDKFGELKMSGSSADSNQCQEEELWIEDGPHTNEMSDIFSFGSPPCPHYDQEDLSWTQTGNGSLSSTEDLQDSDFEDVIVDSDGSSDGEPLIVSRPRTEIKFGKAASQESESVDTSSTLNNFEMNRCSDDPKEKIKLEFPEGPSSGVLGENSEISSVKKDEEITECEPEKDQLRSSFTANFVVQDAYENNLISVKGEDPSRVTKDTESVVDTVIEANMKRNAIQIPGSCIPEKNEMGQCWQGSKPTEDELLSKSPMKTDDQNMEIEDVVLTVNDLISHPSEPLAEIRTGLPLCRTAVGKEIHTISAEILEEYHCRYSPLYKSRTLSPQKMDRFVVSPCPLPYHEDRNGHNQHKNKRCNSKRNAYTQLAENNRSHDVSYDPTIRRPPSTKSAQNAEDRKTGWLNTNLFCAMDPPLHDHVVEFAVLSPDATSSEENEESLNVNVSSGFRDILNTSFDTTNTSQNISCSFEGNTSARTNSSFGLVAGKAGDISIENKEKSSIVPNDTFLSAQSQVSCASSSISKEGMTSEGVMSESMTSNDNLWSESEFKSKSNTPRRTSTPDPSRCRIDRSGVYIVSPTPDANVCFTLKDYSMCSSPEAYKRDEPNLVWKKKTVSFGVHFQALTKLPGFLLNRVGNIVFSKHGEMFTLKSGESSGTVVGLQLTGEEVAIKWWKKSEFDIIQKALKQLPCDLEHDRILNHKAIFEDSHLTSLSGLKEDGSDATCLSFVSYPLCEHNLLEYLSTILVRDPTPQRSKVMICKQLMEGLHYLHSLDIIHGRLKPQNVLIDISGKVKLADFGLPASLSDAAICWQPTETHTQEPPITVTKAGDIQVAGMLLHYCLSNGIHPFGRSEEEVISYLKTGEPLPPNFSDQSFFMVTCMLQKDPQVRPTASQCLGHTFFWEMKKSFRFLIHVSQELLAESLQRDKGQNTVDPKVLKKINCIDLRCKNWKKIVDPNLRKNIEALRGGAKYCPSVTDLLRFMEHVSICYPILPPDKQALIGDIEWYFLSRFNSLPYILFGILRGHTVAWLPRLREFFTA